ncbi:hypothetical protein CRM22_000752 [Opisthorchis felineus]|uniref:Protein unc-79 homolog n=1 Tax=Opisthorchis felineus TaxID=147828 RepID=A0A4S2MDY3_OPIFE|nr:hypothetical protein CRM22_000752 [Opisthorchis felineus]
MSNQRTQTFSSKLKLLQESCSKLSGITGNIPSSSDVISYLKYFQSALHGFAKEIQELQISRFENRLNDHEWRLQFLPQLAYGDLYLCILNLSENAQKLGNQSAVCDHLMRTLHNLMIFLDYDCLEGVPLALSWMLTYFPAAAQSSVIELMCAVVIPLVYNCKDDQESYAIDSIPSILTLVFQHVEKIEYHVWVVESFLSKKKELHKDLLLIIAYGPTEARLPAVCLLFHYWPEIYPPGFHANQTLRPLHYVWEPWKPLTCDRTDCPNKAGKAFAMKMTVNPRIAAQHGGKPPPLYVCLDCADALNRRDFDQLVDILLPSKQISLICESKTCRSKNNQAAVTCYSTDCTFLTGNRAIRFCDACHTLRHSYGQATSSASVSSRTESRTTTSEPLGGTLSTTVRARHSGQHIYQMSLPDVWDMALDLQSSMVEAIVSLTRETMPRWRQILLGGGDAADDGTNVRAVSGLTCTGPNPPGGPPSGDMMLLGVNPPGSATGHGLLTSTGTGMQTMGITQCSPYAEFGQGTTSGSRGIAGLTPTGTNASGEVGELSLIGRYTEEDHKVLAVYGALLVGEKCWPREFLNIELLTRITAGIFNWFLDTIYTAEDEVGDLLEKVKSEYILKWIQEVQRLHPEAIFAVLLPHPLEHARVGSCWDALCDRTTQVKHGLSRIGSLIPYDIVTFETWDFVMPYWLESIRTEVPRADYFELEILLKKIFDATAGPFPFLPQKVYHFAAERFISTPPSVQDQALAWLEILTSVEVPIPMKELLTMFRNGVEGFQTELLLPENDNYEEDEDALSDDGKCIRSASVPKQISVTTNIGSRPPHKQGTTEVGVSGTDSKELNLESSGRRDPAESETESDEDVADETRVLLSTKQQSPQDSTLRKPRRSFSKCRTPHKTRTHIKRPNSGHSVQNQASGKTESDETNERPSRTQSQPPRKTEKLAEPSKTARRRRSLAHEYRMTECLAQMLNIAYRQLRLHDPVGHGGYTQETPQLLLQLLGDMLQLYWGQDGPMSRKGLQELYCAGLETCIFPTPTQPQDAHQSFTEVQPPRSECMYCLDMLTWMNYAVLICQHLAPVRPAPKATVEFTVEALTAAAEFPEYTGWGVTGIMQKVNEQHSLPQAPSIIEDPMLYPSPIDIVSMPPVIRFVYLLVRFLQQHRKLQPTSESETIDPVSNNTGQSSQQDVPTDTIRVTKDPIVLQCVLECLAYLCHVGDCLQQVLSRTETSDKSGLQSSIPSIQSTAGGRNGGTAKLHHMSIVGGSGNGATQIAGCPVTCTATSMAQANFIHYLVHCHLIPNLWGLLKSELSHLASWTVPLLLHCILLPGGAKVFWRIVESAFGHDDWRVRFDAIERVTVLMRELDHQVMSRGFSGAAGVKITGVLSGGSMASASGMTLFGRSAASGPTSRPRATGGRMLTGKGGFNRGHGNVSSTGDGKVGASAMAAAAAISNESPLLRSALAHAFCCLVGSLNDSNSIIAQYTASQLASLNNTALLCGIQCLEFQFDTVIADRCLILQRMHQLSSTLQNRQVFTWEFFVNRFGLLALQAQMTATGQQDIDAVTDLNGYHRNSQHFQSQFERACFAISKCTGLRSVSELSRAKALRSTACSVAAVTQSQLPAPAAQRSSYIDPGGGSQRGANSERNATGNISPTGDGQETASRPQTPHFQSSRRERPSMASFTGFFSSGPAGMEFMDSSNKFFCNIRNALDQDSEERDTLHLWVRLLLRFMSTIELDARPDDTSSGSGSLSGSGRHSVATAKDELRDRKALSKAQRHLAFLLGYADGAFNIPPHTLRNSTVFHSFLAHVMGVLDRNYGMGSCILHQTLVVLQYCASPQRYATDTQPPTFSLRLLEPQIRLDWLQTLLVILYKYEYSAPGGTIPSGQTGSVGAQTGYNTTLLNHPSLAVGGVTNNGTGTLGKLRKSSSEITIRDQEEVHRTVIGTTGGSTGANIGQGQTGSMTVAGSSNVSASVTPNAFALGHTYLAGPSSTPPGGTRGIVEYLIQVVLNTLDAHAHVCRDRTEDEPFDQPSPPVRLREISNVSADFTTIFETDTPPASPPAEGEASDDDAVVMPGVTITLCNLDGDENANKSNTDSETHALDKQPDKQQDTLIQLTCEIKPKGRSRAQHNYKTDKMEQEIAARMESSNTTSDVKVVKDSVLQQQQQQPTTKGLPERASPTLLKSPQDQMDFILPVAPSTVSLDEQAINAPILTDGIEMTVLQERKTSPASSLTTSPQVPDTTLDTKASKRVALRLHKRTVAEGSDEREKELTKDECTKHPPSGTQSLDSNYNVVGQRVSKPKHTTCDPSKHSSPISTGRAGITTKHVPDRESRASKIADDQGRPDRESSIPSSGTQKIEKKKSMAKPSSSPHVQAPVSRSGSMSNLATAAASAALTTERCPWCHQVLERYDESTLGLGMLCLATFVHREPSLAAPYLKDMLLIAARLTNTSLYSWQTNLPHIIVPGNVASIARQFLRCTMYNLAPNGLFLQLFQTPIPDEHFFRCIISVLVDFEEHMSFFQPVLQLLEALNKRKTLPTDTLPVLLENIASYLEHLPNLTDDVKVNHFIASGWADTIGPLDLFLRKLATVTPIPSNLATTVRIMTYILRAPVASNFKTLPDTFSAILRLIVENVPFRLSSVIELCSLSSRTLKERTKIQLTKTLVELFHQAIKFRISIPDENLVKLLQFILMDAGGTLEPNQVVEGLTTLFNPQTYHLFSTGAAELMRPHLTDCIAFLSDVHTMHKVKQAQKLAIQLNIHVVGGGPYPGVNPANGVCGNGPPNLGASAGLMSSGTGMSGVTVVGGSAIHGGSGAGGGTASGYGGNTGLNMSIPSIHEDVLGAHLKSGLAQYISLELSRSSSCNDQDVITLLAPGLLADIRPLKNTGFTSSNTSQRLKPPSIQPQAAGSVTATPTSGALLGAGLEGGSGRSTRPSSSVISKSSDDHPSERIIYRNTDTMIVVTHSAGNTVSESQQPDNGEAQPASVSASNSTTGLRIQTPIPSNSSSPASCQITPSPVSAAGISLTSPPGAPITSSPRLGTHGHVTLAPTSSQNSQLDAPVLHLLPWLKSIPPSSQLGPRDFLVMVERVRTLSWLLLGATMNMALTREATGLACRPVPFVLVRAVADLVKALLSSFPDQQKQSVTVMSSLYHAFLLCQVWTVYCETAASLSPAHSTQHKAAVATAVDFWTRIMPTVLRLLSISEDFVIVSGRLLTVMEELMECQCAVVTKLFPVWIPMLCGRHRQLPGNMLKRLQKCIEWEPPEPYTRLLLLFSLPDPSAGGSTVTGRKHSAAKGSSHDRTAPIHTTSHSLPGLTAESLLACQANSLMGCNPLSKTSKGLPEETAILTGGVQCAGHALASSAPYSSDGVGTGVGIGAGALGTDLLTSRLVAWLKKHIFVLGRNEDQHSTATHIFVH